CTRCKFGTQLIHETGEITRHDRNLPHAPTVTLTSLKIPRTRLMLDATSSSIRRRTIACTHFGGAGMAEERWSTMSQRSPFLTKVKLYRAGQFLLSPSFT